MKTISDLLNAGYNVKYSHELLERMVKGVAEHHGRIVGNGILRNRTTLQEAAPVRHSKLIDAADRGQTPSYTLIGDILTSPAAFFRLPPGAAFQISCSSGLLLPFSGQDGAGKEARSTHGALLYSYEHLGVREFRVVFGDDAPILPYILEEKPSTGVFMELYRPYWDAELAALKTSEKYKAAPLKERFRLVAIELLQTSANRAEEALLSSAKRANKTPDYSVVPFFFSSEDSELSGYYRQSPEHAYFERRFPITLRKPPHTPSLPEHMGGSCCDSRSLFGHTFCAKPGEFHELNTVAMIAANHHDVLQSGRPNSTYLQLELAKAEGCKSYTFMSHGKCGGIAALVSWSLDEAAKPQEPHLAYYLEQAKPIADAIVEFARKNGFIDNIDSLCRVTEKHIMRWSATNIQRFLGSDAQVLATHMDIHTRDVYPLPLIDESTSPESAIAQTWELHKLVAKNELITLPKFYDILVEEERARHTYALSYKPSADDFSPR